MKDNPDHCRNLILRNPEIAEFLIKFYDPACKALTRYFWYRMNGDFQDVEDMVHGTMLDFMENLSRNMVDLHQPIGYLMRIAHNRWVDHIKEIKKHQRVSLSEDD